MVNLPLPDSLDKECLKAAKTLRSFTMPEAAGGIDSIIPPSIIENSKGLVILTVVKAGFLFSGRIGFGLVVAKLPNGTWSAPSAIGTGSFGAGLQIGAELTDFVIVLNNQRAVESFSYGGNVALGGNLSVAAGPVGRNAEAAAMATIAATYSYSKTKGLFAGVSLEGTVFAERADANEKMYGRKVKARDLLTGSVPPPPEAAALYDALRRHESSAHLMGTTYVTYPGDPVHHDNLSYPVAPAAKSYGAPPPGYPSPPNPSSSSSIPSSSSSAFPSSLPSSSISSSSSSYPPAPVIAPALTSSSSTSPSTSVPSPAASLPPYASLFAPPPAPPPPPVWIPASSLPISRTYRVTTSAPYPPTAAAAPIVLPSSAPYPTAAAPIVLPSSARYPTAAPATVVISSPYPAHAPAPAPAVISTPYPPAPIPAPAAAAIPTAHPESPSSTKTFAFSTVHHHRHHKTPETMVTTYTVANPPAYPLSPTSSSSSPSYHTTPYPAAVASSSSSHAAPPLPSRQSTVMARALYDYPGQRAGDLAFKAGDVISVTEKTASNQDWWRGLLGGREGAFPANYVQLI